MALLTDKQLKKKYEIEFRKAPEKYYPTEAPSEMGYRRGQCTSCGRFFWSTDAERTVCGDSACVGGFSFIGSTPAKKKLDYIQVWQTFSHLLRKRGYTPIPRYPVVARWRGDIPFVEASVDDFIPYVVNGEVDPPANPLTVPQFCLRFNDVDNVGITGAHYTGFVMMGQHRFHPPSEYRPNDYFRDLFSWLSEGMGIPKEEITLHEDVWAGSGNFGPCVEFFSRGLEIANQVYMQYRQTETGYEDLKLKVLDMGQGQERAAWFCQGASTSFETTFPTVMRRLYERTGLSSDQEVIRRFLPYASFLNVDEAESIDRSWQFVAGKVGMPVKELREAVLPRAALYSIAEHSRSLLVALTDSGLPSNVGGGYNLRVVLRRALGFVDRYKWDIDLAEVCEWHAAYLKPLFPELSESLDLVREILAVEKERFLATKEKSRAILQRMVREPLSEAKLLELYDSHGISPEMVRETAQEAGVSVEVPDNFYARVAELHGKQEQALATHKEHDILLSSTPESEPLYFDDYTKVSFTARVAASAGNQVVLDKTYFYPTSGGQIHDTGSIAGIRVVEVFKHGSSIIHLLEKDSGLHPGQEVPCEIDPERRFLLAKHHTATHIVNAAARRVLGRHINQAGAKKTPEKAHLDITHYRNVSPEEVARIEEEANAIVSRDLPVKSAFMRRDQAERLYGMSIYQGGAVPGRVLRIIDIEGTDAEACGGTHLRRTGEAGRIRILKAKKIQDGIVRLTFTAGEASAQVEGEEDSVLGELASSLKVDVEQLPARCEELFTKWKKARKALQKGKPVDMKEFDLVSAGRYEGDVLAKCAEVFSTQPEHVPKTAKRFFTELTEFKAELTRGVQHPPPGTEEAEETIPTCQLLQGGRDSPQQVKLWHIAPLFDLVQKEYNEHIKIYDTDVKTIKGLLHRLNGGEDPYKNDRPGPNNQLYVVVGKSNKRRLLLYISTDKGEDRNTSYSFSFDSALGREFRKLTSEHIIECFFLWCAGESKTDATFFFIPAKEILEHISPGLDERTQIRVVKREGCWWIKGRVMCDIDAKIWAIPVKGNNYSEVASKLSNTLNNLNPVD